MDLSAHTLWLWLTDFSLKLVSALLILLIGKWLAHRGTNLLAALLEKNKTEATLVSFLKNITYYALLAAVVITSLSQLGVNTASFLTVIGAAGLAIGLALKDSLGHFSAGVMLILFRPFKVGDMVTAGGVSGTVKAISVFNTELATADNQQVLIPNSSIMSNIITNITANPTRRIDLLVNIGYGDDIAKARATLTRLLQEDRRILVEPAPAIAVLELGATSINLAVRPWVNTPDYWEVRFELTEKIKNEFDKEGISFPFPQQDVHLFVKQQA